MYCRGYTKTNFPCLQIVSGKYCVHHKKQYDMCSICYDDIVHPMRLQCNHLFCRNCIMKYEANTTELLRCPLCRKKDERPFLLFRALIHYIIESTQYMKYKTEKQRYEQYYKLFLQVIKNDWILYSYPKIVFTIFELIYSSSLSDAKKQLVIKYFFRILD